MLCGDISAAERKKGNAEGKHSHNRSTPIPATWKDSFVVLIPPRRKLAALSFLSFDGPEMCLSSSLLHFQVNVWAAKLNLIARASGRFLRIHKPNWLPWGVLTCVPWRHV